MRVLCYKCGDYGYLGLGWTKSRYRLKFYGWYYFYYVSHYSPERKRCYIREGILWEESSIEIEKCNFAYCDYRIEKNCDWPNLIKLEIQRKRRAEDIQSKKEKLPRLFLPGAALVDCM